ncbi:MAG: hypothetical protein M1819_000487 [Sarea resinae]|nr:MAG: hypothetical protein M1819_000487 [Sarea resinae]
MATVIHHRRTGISEEESGSSSSSLSPPDTKGGKIPSVVETISVDSGLGVAKDERKFWFQRARGYDRNAIATQPSVFDDPDTAKHYAPRSDWENLHRFDPSTRWTWGEENKLIRKIDFKIFIFACLMFMSLELDRANLNYNLGNTVFRLSFLCAELPSQLVSKWIGPDRWIPGQMILWSIVATAQFWLSGRSSFLACRALLGILQGGFIPDMVLYLSYFYKHSELTLRLGFWWTAMNFADILASFLAYGLLHLGGSGGHAGWRWLFLIEGLLTLVMGILAVALMPPSPTQTANWIRGKKGWFTSREETIMVNRIIREDPSKSSMHNRQPITPKLLWQSLQDYDLWPLYIIGLTFQTPTTTPYQYLPLSLRGLGFNTFQTNLLTIPYKVLSIITMLLLTYISELTSQPSLMGFLAQVWTLPFLIYLYIVDINSVNKWVAWTVMTLLLGFPSAHAIQVGWNSRNSNSVRSRTVSAAIYNMCVQASSIIASNIYRSDDAPLYHRGNRVLLALAITNLAIYALTKLYYILRNRSRDRVWDAMTPDEKETYLATTVRKGNKRLDFRFAA